MSYLPSLTPWGRSCSDLARTGLPTYSCTDRTTLLGRTGYSFTASRQKCHKTKKPPEWNESYAASISALRALVLPSSWL